jgi:hypothetical protein
MKSKVLFLAMLAFAFAFTACVEEDDDDNGLPDLQEQYFEIYGASYNTGAMPAAGDGPTITDLSGNGTVLAGGSNNIGITTDGAPANCISKCSGS